MLRLRYRAAGFTPAPGGAVGQCFRVATPPCICAAAIVVLTFGSARAQTPAPAIPPAQIFNSKAQPLIDTPVTGDPRLTNPGNALRWLDWLIYPTAATGVAYDSNVNSTPTNTITAYGPRFQPAIIADHNTGIQHTIIYGVGDLRYYPSVGLTQVQDTRPGMVHLWEVQRDFLVRTQGQVTRTEDPLGLTDVGTGLIPVDPVKTWRLFGSGSVEKGFGRFFTGLGGSITRENFEDTKTPTGMDIPEGFRDGTKSTINARLGYHITPLVYTFVEPSSNWARHNASNLDSQGYQVVAGLGSARIGLMNGEIYGGYWAQSFEDPTIAPLSTGVYGGRISYFPTRFLVLTASLDQGTATSDFSTRTFVPGSVTKTNSAKFDASWDWTRSITLGGAFQYQRLDYLSTFRKDTVLRSSGNITYWLNPRFGMKVEYTYYVLETNVPGGNYSRSLISVSGNTKF